MIECSVCHHFNEELALKCSSCGSIIQDKVPSFDFFAMIWMLIESPKQALKKIVIAEHKNFVLLQSLFFGIALIFALMWAQKSGDNYDNLLLLLIFGSVLGVFVGIPVFFIISGAIHFTSKLFRGIGHWRETYGVIGWSLMPIMISTVIILPLEFATIGLYFFSSNPSGYEVKPVIFIILFGFDCLLVAWSLILGSIGISIAHRFSIIKSFIITAAVMSLVSYASFTIYSSFKI